MIQTVLVVDDYQPWRRHVTSTLQDSSRWQVIGEASDGPEAIEKALTLRPDLILLDIGLPTLNGIEAARRILANDAHLKILFVSEHHSLDIVEAALCTGGRGYVCKSDAGRELSHAMEAVVTGRRFVGARLGGRVVPKTPGDVGEARRHEVAFYADRAELIDEWARLAEAAFDAGDGFIVAATDSSAQQVRELLKARGVDVDRAVRDGRYVPLKVSEVLSTIMLDDFPDEKRFWEATIPLMMTTAYAAPRRRVVACGELALILWSEGKTDAALRLEQLWDEAGATFALDIFCGYLSSVQLHDAQEALTRLCSMHTAVHSR